MMVRPMMGWLCSGPSHASQTAFRSSLARAQKRKPERKNLGICLSLFLQRSLIFRRRRERLSEVTWTCNRRLGARWDIAMLFLWWHEVFRRLFLWMLLYRLSRWIRKTNCLWLPISSENLGSPLGRCCLCGNRSDAGWCPPGRKPSPVSSCILGRWWMSAVGLGQGHGCIYRNGFSRTPKP